MNILNNIYAQGKLEWENSRRETGNLCEKFNLPRDTVFKAMCSGAFSSLATLLTYSLEGATAFGGLPLISVLPGIALTAVLATLIYAVAVAILRKYNFQNISVPSFFFISAVCLTGAFLITSALMPHLLMSVVEIICLAVFLACVCTFANRRMMDINERFPLDRCVVFII